MSTGVANMSLQLSYASATTQGRLGGLSLNAKICIAATGLVVASLAITATVIGIKSSSTAEEATMELARTSSREAASALQTRIRANLASVAALGGAMTATKTADMPLARPQIDEMVKATLLGAEDFIGAAVTWEPNALDGKDADFTGKKPAFDDTGRHMPYWTRNPGGGFNVEAIVFDPAPGANDWYDIPKKTGKVHFTEPYNYPIDGKPVLMASLVLPLMIKGKFQGVASADFTLTQLGKILADLKVMQGGQLALVSNGGLYASHPNAEQVNKKAEDIPQAGLEAIRKG